MLLGDWGSVVRDPIDLLRWSCAAGLVVFTIQGNTAVAARFAVTTALVFFARWLCLPRVFDLSFVFTMCIQGWGTALDLFSRWGWFDVFVHSTVSCSVAALLYLVLSRVGVVPPLAGDLPRHHITGVIVVTFALGLATGALFEMYEWGVNQVFGPTLAVGYGDTIGDLADDALGGLVAGVLVAVWATRGWATTRRLLTDPP
jgi:hypothetical protein